MIAAVYARKSNLQDGANGASESVERQVAHAREYATKHGWTVPDQHVFVDDGVSGAEYAKLDGRKRMVAAAEAAVFQVLVVAEQARLGRDLVESVYTIQKISESGVTIHTYLDGLQISVEDETAQAMTMLRGFASASERRQASRRTFDAALRRFMAGHVAGAKIYGYTHEDVFAPDSRPRPKRLHVVRRVHPDQAAVVRRIFELYADGLGSTMIARRLNAEAIPSPRPKGWQQTTVRGILRNRIYIGETTWGRIRTTVRKGRTHNLPNPENTWRHREVPELRIVDQPLWDRVQARRTGRREAFPRSPRTGQLLGRPTWHDGHSEYLVTGFGRCAACGGNIRITHQKYGGRPRRVVRFYLCATNDTLGGIKCANATLVRHERVDAAVLAAIAEVLHPQVLEAAVERALAQLRAGKTDHDGRRQQIERELGVIAARFRRLTEAIASGDAPAPLLAALRAEEARRQALTAERDQLAEGDRSARLSDAKIRRALRAKIADVRGLLTENVQQGRAVLRALLAGPIAFEPMAERRGFRFRGELAIDRLIAGEAVTSLTGSIRADTSAAGREPARRACDCRGRGPASPR